MLMLSIVLRPGQGFKIRWTSYGVHCLRRYSILFCDSLSSLLSYDFRKMKWNIEQK